MYQNDISSRTTPLKLFFFHCCRCLIAKKIELELKESDESKFNQTMKELCDEPISNDNLWYQYTHGNEFFLNRIYIITLIIPFLSFIAILRTAIGLKSLLGPIMNGDAYDWLRPRLG